MSLRPVLGQIRRLRRMLIQEKDPIQRKILLKALVKNKASLDPGSERFIAKRAPQQPLQRNFEIKMTPAGSFVFQARGVRSISVNEASDHTVLASSVIMGKNDISVEIDEEFAAVAVDEVRRDIEHIDAVIERYDAAAARARRAIAEANKRLSPTVK